MLANTQSETYSVLLIAGVVLSLLVGLGGVAATIRFYGQVHGLREASEFLGGNNDALRKTITDNDERHRREMREASQECDAKMDRINSAREESARLAAQETAELRGQVVALKDGVVHEVARVAAETVVTATTHELIAALTANQAEAAKQLMAGQAELLAAVRGVPST